MSAALRCRTRHATREFGGIEAVAVGERHLRLKPDFGILAAAFDVNVARFARLALSFE